MAGANHLGAVAILNVEGLNGGGGGSSSRRSDNERPGFFGDSKC